MEMTDARTERLVAAVLIACLLVVGFWEGMAIWSRRPWEPFSLTAADFDDFAPSSGQWEIRRVPVSSDPVEPNILAFAMVPRSGTSGVPVLARLVHGYNMRDCMRIKGYKVELIGGLGVEGGKWKVVGGRREAGGGTREEEGGEPEGQVGTTRRVVRPGGNDTAENSRKDAKAPEGEWKEEGGRREGVGGESGGAGESENRRMGERDTGMQLWRLTSETGEVAVWITSLLRATDFEPVDRDVRSLPFPRIGVPDDPRWLPEGITLRSLRHPATSFRHFLRTKWNNARCDPWVFLGLKQPPWASEEVLTLVANSRGIPVSPANEAEVVRDVLAAHAFLQQQLKEWAGRSGGGEKAVRL